MRCFRAVLVVVVVALAGGLTPTTAEATFPGANGLIAFDDDGYVWTVRPDGSGKKRLATGTHPRWSPDGRRIAFDRDVNGDRELFTMRADGSNVVRVTTASGWDTGPSWSSDGSKLVFTSDRSGRPQLYVVNSTKPFGAARRLTPSRQIVDGVSREVSSSNAEWSPDGKLIVFVRGWQPDPTQDSLSELATVKVDGTGIRAVPNGDGPGTANTQPRWGPGMRRIAFSSERYIEVAQHVYSVPFGTTGPRIRITEGPDGGDEDFKNELGSWSPDGRNIVYVHDGSDIIFNGAPDSTFGLAIRPSDGRGKFRIVLPERGIYNPDWGPAPT